jgi:predicted glycosyltransferase
MGQQEAPFSIQLIRRRESSIVHDVATIQPDIFIVMC